MVLLLFPSFPPYLPILFISLVPHPSLASCPLLPWPPAPTYFGLLPLASCPLLPWPPAPSFPSLLPLPSLPSSSLVSSPSFPGLLPPPSLASSPLPASFRCLLPPSLPFSHMYRRYFSFLFFSQVLHYFSSCSIVPDQVWILCVAIEKL